MTQSVPQTGSVASPLMVGAVGFGEGFIINLICGGTAAAGVLGGAASSVASLLNTAVKPFFANIFGESPAGRLAASCSRAVVVVSAVSCAVAAATSTLPLLKVAISVNLVATILVRYIMTMTLSESPLAIPRPQWLGPEHLVEPSHFDAVVIVPFFA